MDNLEWYVQNTSGVFAVVSKDNEGSDRLFSSGVTCFPKRCEAAT